MRSSVISSTVIGRLQPREASNEVGAVSHDIDRAGGCFSHRRRGHLRDNRRDVGCLWRTGEWPAVMRWRNDTHAGMGLADYRAGRNKGEHAYLYDCEPSAEQFIHGRSE